jgi:glycosyltransferase involved in cell wall biosynthesis
LLNSAAPSRLVVVDQSLKGGAGHHLNYSFSVAFAGTERWASVTVAANRAFAPDAALVGLARGKGVRILPWFSVDWFDQRDGGLGAWRRKAGRIRRAVRSRAADGLRRGAFVLTARALLLAGGRVRKLSSPLRGLAYGLLNGTPLRRILRQGLDQLGVAGLLRAPVQLVRRAGRFGLRVAKLGLAMTAALAAPLVLLPVGGRSKAQPAGIFAREVLKLIEAEGLGPADDVLIHTLGAPQLDQVFDLMLRFARPDWPTLHVVLRRDAAEPLSNMPGFPPIAETVARFGAAGCFGGRIRFYCDTRELCAQYGAHLGAWPRLLPIPPIALPAGAPAADGPLTVVYLGNARTEKGFHLLPAMVEATLAATPRPLRFRIQAEFNLDGGEPGIPEARAALERMGEAVEVIPRALDEAEYAALLGSADIVLLPYSQRDYARRSSGILVEAVAAGRVAVVPEGTSLASMGRLGAAVTYSDTGGMAPALLQAVRDIAVLRARAAARAPRFRGFHTPGNVCRRIARRHAQAGATRPGGCAVVVINEYVGYGTALDRLVEAQIRYLRGRGLHVHLWVADLMRLLESRRQRDRFPPGIEALGADEIAYFDAPVGADGLARVFDRTRHEISVQAQLDNMAVFELSARMRRVLAEDAPEVLLCNYVFCEPLMQKAVAALGPRARTVTLCETHDVQALQMHYRRSILGRGSDLATELDLLTEARHLSRFDAVLAVTRQEEAVLSRAMRRPAHWVPFGIRMPARVAERPARYDLLFVGSWHTPNADGVAWLVEQVLPLCAHRPRLAVAGRVCGVLPEAVKTAEGVTALDFVDDLDTLYAESTLVVVPLRSGAGVSVKTVEAMAYGRALVATSVGLRGLEEAPVVPQDDPAAFAAEIDRLLAEPEARRDLGEAACAWAEANFAYPAFRAAMDRILGEVTARRDAA